jgi:signal transduction histidine kinase/CheY-like chemotaxis protein/HPt (histidine-containing phosphotransfer) domain-containing protein
LEQRETEKKEQRGQERLILLLFSVHYLYMFTAALNYPDNIGLLMAIFGSFMFCWMLYIAEKLSFRTRVFVTVFLMQFSIVLYGMRFANPYYILPTMLVVAILIGLYGIAELLYIAMAGSAIYIFYHLVIARTIVIATKEDLSTFLLEVVNVFLAEGLLYFWVRKRTESGKKIAGMIAELKAAEHSKDDFLANVSHEIRTPINTICGMSEMAVNKEDPVMVREDLLEIQAAGKNLLSVVSDILDFSELQTGKVELEEENYNITSTINDIFGMIDALKGDKPIEFIINCDANIPCGLLGDEKKIRRVVLNLVNNALKFTNEGYISIEVSFRKENYGVNLSVEVKDTGIGMSEQDQEKLFRGFTQVDGSRKRAAGGMGLGLAISGMLVQKMGGVMTVASKPGKGSIIRFVVPQKVTDYRPIASVNKREEVNAAIYINMEQFRMESVRGAYADSIRRIVEQLNVKAHICRNLQELKRRVEREVFSHIFITIMEYREDQDYFDEICHKTRIVMVLDSWDMGKVQNKAIAKVCKPLYVIPIVTAVNGGTLEEHEHHMLHHNHFIAPDVRALAVDDNEMNLKVIAGLLEQYQIKVTTVTSGKQALAEIERTTFDLVLMDHMMPEMDGVETLHRIRSMPGSYYKKVPVIAVSANAVAGSREMFLAEGFNDFVEKPIDLSNLERKLKKYLPAEKQLAPDVTVDVQEAEEEMKPEEIPVIGDLSVETGIAYCGGEQTYLEILKGHATGGAESVAQIESLYQEENWKNYTISVHAVKSSMKTIGAMKLSEMAKELETAGKEGRISDIRDGHAAMVEEYRRVVAMLQTYFGMEQKQTEEEIQAKLEESPVLSEEQMEKYLADFEEAAFDFDGDKMAQILSEMQEMQYGGRLLREALEPIQRKVDKSDYLSAAEALKKMASRRRQEGTTV